MQFAVESSAITEGSDPQARLQSFLGKGVAKLALASLSQCLAGNAELAAHWRRCHLEQDGAAWLDRFLTDREAEVRANAFTLAASIAVTLVEPESARAADPGQTDGALRSQQTRLLDTAAECALDPHEADVVRQQALQYVVRATARSRARKTTLVNPPAAKELSWDSLQSSNVSDQATAASSVVRTTGRVVVASASAQAPFVLEILERHSFLEQVLSIATDPDRKDAWYNTRVRSGCFAVLKNMTLLDPALTSELFSKHDAVARLVRFVDVQKQLEVATEEQLGPGASSSSSNPMRNETWSFQRTILFASQWLCTVGPSALHGAASVCDLLRIRLAAEPQPARSDPNPAWLLGTKHQTLQALVALLCFRPAAMLCASGVHLEHSWEHRLLSAAEVDAKQGAASLLCQLLLVPSAASELAPQLLHRGLLRGLLGMLAPLYPPRVRYLACTLLARVLLCSERGHRSSGSDEGAQSGSRTDQGAEAGEVSKAGSEHRELAKAAILYFDELFSASDGVHVDSELGLEAHRDAVVAALSALMSWSR
eukprot:3173899-Rhodomonas_salina.2